jgi:hypothetical protein
MLMNINELEYRAALALVSMAVAAHGAFSNGWKKHFMREDSVQTVPTIPE